MLTLRAAADLLAATTSIAGLEPIAAAAGCDRDVSPLSRETCQELGLADAVTQARIASGPGALRALLIVLGEARPARDALPSIAARLAARAPHALWLVVATHGSGDLAITAWTGDRRPPRVAALVANRARLTDSDAETLRALSAAAGDRDLLVHARWVEILGREALGGRFYRALDGAVRALAESSRDGTREARAELALLNTSRLLFLCFLEAKGWLHGDAAFLTHQFDRCVTGRGRFHDRVLRPLFFGTLNTPPRQRAPAARAFGAVPFLNGGLFARTPLERRHRGLAFSDDAYGRLIYGVFGQYRFTAREETSTWTEAAVDPEMLGRAFESLMAAGERQSTGAYFTPFSLVERLTDAGLDVALERCTLDDLTVLDPACGSGAFLVHALERLAARRADLSHAGNGVQPPVDVGTIRRAVLTRSIFGVDVNPTAVWLCQLRLWLSVVIESTATDPSAVIPLPNLDRNIRVGDALAGRAFGDEDTLMRGGRSIDRLRQRYASASGARKDALARQLDRAERARALEAIDGDLARIAAHRRDLVLSRRGRDLFGDRYVPSADERIAATALRAQATSLRAQRRRVAEGGALAFAFPVHFADIAARGGFRLVVGNPPWVRLHRVAVERRVEFRRAYFVARNAAWEPGAGGAGAGRGFAAQVDVAALFVERGTSLLARGGALAFLLPVKLWRSLAGGGVRRWIAGETVVRRLEDHSDGVAAFDAAVYPSLLIVQRELPGQSAAACARLSVHHAGREPFEWDAPSLSFAYDATPGAPWILLPPDARRAFDMLRSAGPSLASSTLGRPRLGVKCGFNDAFVFELLDADDDLAEVRACGGDRVVLEVSLLRPLLRGEGLRRWRPPDTRERILWTHDASGAALRSLPAHAARWLARWRRDLVARTDARHRTRWWSLFRTESARFDLPRVVWSDIGREPRACVLDAGDPSVPLNSCYVVRCRDAQDAHAFAALLNGPLARGWLDALAEPARGGYHRYLGWTISQLPIPEDWERARRVLAPYAERALDGRAPSDVALFSASLEAFAVSRSDTAPLVAWSAR